MYSAYYYSNLKTNSIATNLIYAHSTSVSRATPMMRLQIFAIVYKPTSPKTPDAMYMITAITKNTAGVRPDLKMFLLSLCALNWWKESSISCKQI